MSSKFFQNSLCSLLFPFLNLNLRHCWNVTGKLKRFTALQVKYFHVVDPQTETNIRPQMDKTLYQNMHFDFLKWFQSMYDGVRLTVKSTDDFLPNYSEIHLFTSFAVQCTQCINHCSKGMDLKWAGLGLVLGFLFTLRSHTKPDW